VHPVYFALFPLIAFWAHNVSMGINIYFEMGIALAAAVAGALVIRGLLTLVMRGSARAGLVTTAFLLIFFSYGHLHHFIEDVDIPVGGIVFGPDKILLSASLLIMLVVLAGVRRLKGEPVILTRVLNATGLILVVMTLIHGIGLEGQRLFAHSRTSANAHTAGAVAVNQSGVTKHDIYYIILDCYANSFTLRDVFHMDNSDFEGFLSEKGFRVARESRSNYAKTFLSISSSLNMRYISELPEQVGVKSLDQSIPWKMIENNKVTEFLKNQGYRYINLSINPHKTADLNLGIPFSGMEFQMVMMRTTMLKPFIEKGINHDSRERILYAFDKLKEIPAMPGPKFVYAHIMSPHPPFQFDQHGNPLPDAKAQLDGSVWRNARDKYANQVRFVNSMMTGVIEAILAQSPTEPIIIIQGDHGSVYSFYHEGWDTVDNPTPDNLKEKMRIFNAYHLPEDTGDIVYNGITPVNTFRAIFDHYFGAEFPLLDDRSYYSSEKTPYNWTDVTEQVKFN